MDNMGIKGIEKVIQFLPKIDEQGREYIPFCTFYAHRGIIRCKTTDEECVLRDCRHYERFYKVSKELY